MSADEKHFRRQKKTPRAPKENIDGTKTKHAWRFFFASNPYKPQLIPNAKKHSQAQKKIFMGTKIKIHRHFFLHAMSFFWADGTFFSGGGALFFHGGATFVSRGWSAFVGGPICFANRWAPSGHHDLGSACDQALGQLHFTTKCRKTGRAEVGAGSGGPGLWRGAPVRTLPSKREAPHPPPKIF